MSATTATNSALDEARLWYAGLTKPDNRDTTYPKFIINNLKEAGVGFEELDPTGKKSAADIKVDFDKAVRNSQINFARYLYTELSEPENTDMSAVILIKNNLKYAGVGYEALDPTGIKSAKQIKVEFDGVVKAVYINRARYWRKRLTKPGSTDASADIYMQNNLKYAGVGFEALDPTGRKSAKGVARDMRKALSTNPNMMRNPAIAEFVRGGRLR